jgi:hypothetical protein
MDPQPAKYQPLVIHPGRHVGWWIEGRKSNGHRYMWSWWPTKGLASFVARAWASVLRRLGRMDVPIEVQETPKQAPS